MNASSVLRRQHRRMEQLVGALEGERFARAALLADLAEETAAHFEAERAHLYAGGNGAGAARLASLPHFVAVVARIKAAIRSLGEVTSDGGVAELRCALAEHTSLEESALLPELERELSPEALAALGRAIERTHADELRRARAVGSPAASGPAVGTVDRV